MWEKPPGLLRVSVMKERYRMAGRNVRGEGWRPALAEPLRRRLLELVERVLRRTSSVRVFGDLELPQC